MSSGEGEGPRPLGDPAVAAAKVYTSLNRQKKPGSAAPASPPNLSNPLTTTKPAGGVPPAWPGPAAL